MTNSESCFDWSGEWGEGWESHKRNSKTGERKPMFTVSLHFETSSGLTLCQCVEIKIFMFSLNREEVNSIKTRSQGKDQETETLQKKMQENVSMPTKTH